MWTPRGCLFLPSPICAAAKPLAMNTEFESLTASVMNLTLYGGRGGSGGRANGTGGTGGVGQGPMVPITTHSLTIQSSSVQAQYDIDILPYQGCPPPSKFFTGREDILAQLQACFGSNSKEGCHVVLLHGLGGTGKTEIALKFISGSGDRFADQFKIDASDAATIQAGYLDIARVKNLEQSKPAVQDWLIVRATLETPTKA
ncbi:hypothetical protein MIND_01386500 [Mycena indigotica]|uniref:Orc1-like AAA ATPase domain-containing protein n=1 Tax=Mycena indigotica TaxID=2126181 RepID=A0A8H6RWU7_9AGAR|nr:uncharacterized protein MIND_01386500 [Mycena indigotica]KAF7289250.1 hypothetical protein MIND_01386500 [Mycena indigotica]